MEDKKYPIGGYAPGNYQCRCCDCGEVFIGDKRAVQCEPCAVAAKQMFDALSPSEQKELMKRNAEAVKDMFSKWNKPASFPPLSEPILTDEDVKDWERENKCNCNEPYDSEGGYPACPVHDKPAVAHEPNLAVIGHGTPEIKKRQCPVWPLFVIDKATGDRHEVNKIVYHPENDPAPHIWCDTWYGHHVIGQDCEWLDESAPSGEREVAFAEWCGWDWRRVEGKSLWENQKTLEVKKTAELYEIFKQKKEKR